MKEKKTNLLQVLARRALLVALDGAIVAFSFYFALLLLSLIHISEPTRH